METISKAFGILPENQVDNLQAVYLYNINSSMRQYIEVNERLMRPLKVCSWC